MFYILITFTAPATADEQSAAKTLPAADDAWLDVWHSKFSDSMDFTAQQLDEFFALEGFAYGGVHALIDFLPGPKQAVLVLDFMHAQALLKIGSTNYHVMNHFG